MFKLFERKQETVITNDDLVRKLMESTQQMLDSSQR